MTAFVDHAVALSVPATSANLGPGFDSLGLALDLRDRLVARVLGEGPTRVVVRGEGAGEVPLDERHLVVRAMAAAFARMGVDAPPVHLECDNVIPHARGLGSSSAAIVAGICLARGLVVGGPLALDDDAALSLAVELEGHPDNVAPALLGGFTIAWTDDDGSRAAVVEVDPLVHVVVLVPPTGVETTLSRGLLPDVVSHSDAAANAGRAALLVHALTRAPELLLAATDDRLHQDHREPAMPASLALVRTLRAERVAAVVSGAGPTVLAFTDATGRAAVVDHTPAGWRALPLDVDRSGARVELPSDR